MTDERRFGPVVGLGTWNTFDTDSALAGRVVAAALEAGTRVVDTSPMYRGAERSLGVALTGRRDEAIVATKIWASSVAEGRSQYARQLKWFDGRVDLEQVHNLLAWRDHLPWLLEEREAGRIGRLGVTHYQASSFGELAAALRTGSFDAVQLPYNPWERECERELLPLAADLGVAVLVMRPVGGSGESRRRTVELGDRERRALGVESWAEALLRWSLADDRVDVVLAATADPEHARANVRAGDGRRLDPEQRALVELLATGATSRRRRLGRG